MTKSKETEFFGYVSDIMDVRNM